MSKKQHTRALGSPFATRDAHNYITLSHRAEKWSHTRPWPVNHVTWKLQKNSTTPNQDTPHKHTTSGNKLMYVCALCSSTRSPLLKPAASSPHPPPKQQQWALVDCLQRYGLLLGSQHHPLIEAASAYDANQWSGTQRTRHVYHNRCLETPCRLTNLASLLQSRESQRYYHPSNTQHCPVCINNQRV